MALIISAAMGEEMSEEMGAEKTGLLRAAVDLIALRV
jgi:hypothetical protein